MALAILIFSEGFDTYLAKTQMEENMNTYPEKILFHCEHHFVDREGSFQVGKKRYFFANQTSITVYAPFKLNS